MPTLGTSVVDPGIACMHGTIVQHLCHGVVQKSLLQQCLLSQSACSSGMANT